MAVILTTTSSTTTKQTNNKYHESYFGGLFKHKTQPTQRQCETKHSRNKNLRKAS